FLMSLCCVVATRRMSFPTKRLRCAFCVVQRWLHTSACVEHDGTPVCGARPSPALSVSCLPLGTVAYSPTRAGPAILAARSRARGAVSSCGAWQTPRRGNSHADFHSSSTPTFNGALRAARRAGVGARARRRPGASVEHNFQLASDPLRLDEVVVTGAGTEQLREKLGTAMSSVDAATLQRANESNLVQALAGKLPNVLTNQASGDAGASTSIQIRGPKTFGTSQPTIIVDGVPLSNVTRAENGQVNAPLSGAPSPNRAADLNLDDCESTEVLMGAAATSIYGASAGSAGAILLTSKRGRSGRTQYTLRS